MEPLAGFPRVRVVRLDGYRKKELPLIAAW